MTDPRYPIEEALVAALRSAAGDRLGSELSVLAREPIIMGTFPKEIVTVRTRAGDDRRVMVKYAAGTGHDDHGHRAGVAYESTVYRRLLVPLGIDRPEFLGVYTGDGPGHEWLFLEFLEGARRLTKSRENRVLERAAEWLGGFHAACEASLAEPAIRRFDEGYYEGWVSRAQAATEVLEGSERAPEDVWRGARELVSESLRNPDTVAHNEYYPNNVLVVNGSICPVDWESAAIAPGELDLASLTDGWPPEVVRRCVAVYRGVRWTEGCPRGHSARLLAARVYLHCRWLSRAAEKGKLSGSNARLRRLGELAGELEAIS